MGSALKPPKGLENMKVEEDLEFNLNVKYCGSWGYKSKFDYVSLCTLAIYPRANI